jgi:hypothetical protein
VSSQFKQVTHTASLRTTKRRKFIDGGLLILSRYPITETRKRIYTNGELTHIGHYTG